MEDMIVGTEEIKPPLPNCYKLPHLRALAGEHPYHQDELPGPLRLKKLLDAGVTCFIDLTEPGEAPEYECDLRSEAEPRSLPLEYHRFPIRDVDVPTVSFMRAILAAIHDAEDRGHTVYIHCVGGAGRTGVVVGCLLREFCPPQAALDMVGDLFGTMPKSNSPSHRWGSPQTHAQRQFVRDWPGAECDATARNAGSRFAPMQPADMEGRISSTCSETRPAPRATT